MVEHLTSTTLVDGFGYLEAPRWRDGRLWISDVQRSTVYTIGPDGSRDVAGELTSTPIGLGFVDGTLRVVSSDTKELLTVADGAVTDRVSLGDVAVVAANDMAIDGTGRAYISHFGYDLFGGDEPRPTGLVLVRPDGSVASVGGDLVFPNGVAISADGTRLVVAESFAQRISCFDIEPDGRLTNHSVLVRFDTAEEMVDGICLDAEGGVWVGLPFAGEFRRVDAGGRVTHVVRPERDSFTVACALGGEDLRTLYMAVADTTLEKLADNWGGEARVETVRVEVPGVALP